MGQVGARKSYASATFRAIQSIFRLVGETKTDVQRFNSLWCVRVRVVTGIADLRDTCGDFCDDRKNAIVVPVL